MYSSDPHEPVYSTGALKHGAMSEYLRGTSSVLTLISPKHRVTRDRAARPQQADWGTLRQLFALQLLQCFPPELGSATVVACLHAIAPALQWGQSESQLGSWWAAYSQACGNVMNDLEITTTTASWWPPGYSPNAANSNVLICTLTCILNMC